MATRKQRKRKHERARSHDARSRERLRHALFTPTTADVSVGERMADDWLSKLKKRYSG